MANCSNASSVTLTEIFQDCENAPLSESPSIGIDLPSSCLGGSRLPRPSSDGDESEVFVTPPQSPTAIEPQIPVYITAFIEGWGLFSYLV